MADIEALKAEHPDEWKIFDALDVDNGGTLDKDELWCKLAVNGEDNATQMLEMVDLNGDGVVDFDEFVKAFSGNPQFKALVTDSGDAGGGGAGPERIKLAALQQAMEKAKAAGKCCFICMPNEPSGEPSKADNFLQYSGGYSAIDGKGLVLKKMQGTPVADLIEDNRKAFIMAQKHGNILHFCLRNGCPPLTEDFIDEAVFPKEVWKSCDVPKTEVAAADSAYVGSQTVKKLAKDEECESGMAMCHEKFQIVISSTFGFDDYKEFLDGAKSVPWDDCLVFEVEE